MKKKLNEYVWFTKVRGSYLPANILGWLTYIPFIGYLVFSFIVSVDKTSSLLMAFLLIVPNWVAAGVVLTYIANRMSR